MAPGPLNILTRDVPARIARTIPVGRPGVPHEPGRSDRMRLRRAVASGATRAVGGCAPVKDRLRGALNVMAPTRCHDPLATPSGGDSGIAYRRNEIVAAALARL
jgi:hypothetical protein